MNEQLERKLKRERVEACLNCKKFVGCACMQKVVRTIQKVTYMR